MSLDFDLTFDIDTGNKPYTVTVFQSNITHNVTPMWHKAGVYDALYECHGCVAVSIVTLLRKGLAAMEADPEGYRALDPINKWGSYDGALKFLRNVLAACEDYPNATISISR